MKFTEKQDHNVEDECYYKKAFEYATFQKLSNGEREDLVIFAAQSMLKDSKILFLNNMISPIGSLLDSGEIVINSAKLYEDDSGYPLQLYLFLYHIFAKKYVLRRKFGMKVQEEFFGRRKKILDEHRSDDLDIIILHLMLEEMMELCQLFDGNIEIEEHIDHLEETIKHNLELSCTTRRKFIPETTDREFQENNEVRRGRR